MLHCLDMLVPKAPSQQIVFSAFVQNFFLTHSPLSSSAVMLPWFSEHNMA